MFIDHPSEYTTYVYYYTTTHSLSFSLFTPPITSVVCKRFGTLNFVVSIIILSLQLLHHYCHHLIVYVVVVNLSCNSPPAQFMRTKYTISTLVFVTMCTVLLQFSITFSIILLSISMKIYNLINTVLNCVAKN